MTTPDTRSASWKQVRKLAKYLQRYLPHDGVQVQFCLRAQLNREEAADLLRALKEGEGHAQDLAATVDDWVMSDTGRADYEQATAAGKFVYKPWPTDLAAEAGVSSVALPGMDGQYRPGLWRVILNGQALPYAMSAEEIQTWRTTMWDHHPEWVVTLLSNDVERVETVEAEREDAAVGVDDLPPEMIAAPDPDVMPDSLVPPPAPPAPQQPPAPTGDPLQMLQQAALQQQQGSSLRFLPAG